ncbi:hypothetical protein CA265_11700 [Sphingobacteriaceae bacterium GW460-11-11-14-LB5]|nr:hypothetical protein CA265_11700 [Sphingobacteriaceae bacterium GW460-11-11-14-LB5]
MKNRTIATETFNSGRRNFFLDFKTARNNTNYIQITRSDEQQDGSYNMRRIVVFQEDFEFLISAFCSLFTTATQIEEKEKSVLDLFHENKQERIYGIKGLPVELRPREKLLLSGGDKMKTAELLAILIGSGTPDNSALDIGDQIFKAGGSDLRCLAAVRHADLSRFKGIGSARSSVVLAAIELGRRIFS